RIVSGENFWGWCSVTRFQKAVAQGAPPACGRQEQTRRSCQKRKPSLTIAAASLPAPCKGTSFSHIGRQAAAFSQSGTSDSTVTTFAACVVLCAIELVEGLARDLLRGRA